MAKYLLNTTSSVHLFKGGSLELFPGKAKPVSDNDFNSGIFEDSILTGAIEAYDSLDSIKLPPGVVKAPPEVLTVSSENGATQDELQAFIEAKKKKNAFDPSKYENKESPPESGVGAPAAKKTRAKPEKEVATSE